MSVTVIEKAFRDPAIRLNRLVDALDPKLRRDFLTMILDIKRDFTKVAITRAVTDLLIRGQIQEASRIIEVNAAKFTNEVNRGFVVAGESTAGAISRVAVVSFDPTDPRAVQTMRQYQLNWVTGFTAEQREATRLAVQGAVTRGVGPQAQARAIRDSIGLTPGQVSSVENYRRLLSEDPTEALTRKLRDRRFDRSVERAIRESQPLTRGQIDRMVNRYQGRLLNFRAKNIAQTEAVSAVNEGSNEMYQQAIDTGDLEADELERTWHTAGGKKVRASHRFMKGQKRPFGQAFLSGDGNRLQFPGDRNAPAEDRIHCRCAVSTRLKE